MARPQATTTFLVVFTLLPVFQQVFGLQVTSGSPCSALCIDDQGGDPFSSDSSRTNSSEIICRDSQYANSDSGRKYQKCTECLAKSNTKTGSESDLGWLVYNSRFSITSCLFDFPSRIPDTIIDTSCLTDDRCGSLKTALIDDNLDPAFQDSYHYCKADNGSFVGKHLRPCLECLRSSTDQTYVANFMIVLTGACAYKLVGENETFGIVGSLFSQEEIGISPPKNSTKFHADGAFNSQDLKPKKSFSVPVVAGVAGGVGFVFILAIALFITYYYQERRFQRARFRKLYEMQQGFINGGAELNGYDVYFHPEFENYPPKSGILGGTSPSLGKTFGFLQDSPAVPVVPAPTALHYPHSNPVVEAISAPPVHAAYLKGLQKSAYHRLSPPPSVHTFFSQRATSVASPMSFRSPLTSPAFSTGTRKSRGKRRAALHRLITQRNGDERADVEEEEQSSHITGPLAADEWKKRIKDLPLRKQINMSSRDQKLQQVPLPQLEERPLASGKSLLYGW